jgi:hypothetical protein
MKELFPVVDKNIWLKGRLSRCQWLRSIILATWEAEIKKIAV